MGTNKFNIKSTTSLKEKVPKEEQKKKKASPTIKLVGDDRQTRIANCKECHGNPPTEKFVLQGIEGERCGICWEVVNWKRI